MGLGNARDSFVNLLEFQQEKQDRQQAGEKHNSGKRFLKKQAGSVGAEPAEEAALQDRNNSASSDGDFFGDEMLYYEPTDAEEGDDEHWPTWEMTGEDSWKDNDQSDSNDSDAFIQTAGVQGGDDDIGDRSNSNSKMYAIADCERIFTVPEVYDELMLQEEKRQKECSATRIDLRCKEGSCQNKIVDCFSNLWKPQQLHGLENNAFQSTTSLNSDHSQKNEEQLKGVLKRSSMAVQLYLGVPKSSRQSFTPSMFNVRLDCDDNGNEAKKSGGGGSRSSRKSVSIVGNNHSLMYQGMMGIINGDDSNSNSKAKNKVHFSELKQVLRVRKVTPEEAFYVWFQHQDFEHFKSDMSLLIQEDGASRGLAEAWLEATNERNSQVSETGNDGTGGGGGSDTSQFTKTRSWWHDYDHSRRGLERYASPGQARQILASYKVAVQKVLGEQKRQRLMGLLSCIFPRINCGARDKEHPHYGDDPTVEKIAQVYHEYTAWSRDLALAAGASDADAVLTNFDDDKRHTREYYMLKQVVASGYKVHKHMPQFMLPNCIKPTGFLDEADSLYSDGLGAVMVKKASSGYVPGATKNSTLKGGEEAREEMSRLDSKDLEGPVSPALVPSLQAEEVSNHHGAKAESLNTKRPSMAEKAKNYPFQK